MAQEPTFYAIELATFAGNEYAGDVNERVVIYRSMKAAERAMSNWPRSRVVPVMITKDDKKDGPALIYDEEYVKSLHGKVLELRQTCRGHLSTIDVLQNQLNASRRTIADLEERLSLQGPPPDRIKKLEGEVEQLRVQLAGCLTVAEGETSPNMVCYQGAYGWSKAYQATLNVRRKYDQQNESTKLLTSEIDELRVRNRNLHEVNQALVMRNQHLQAEAVGLKAEAANCRHDNGILKAALTSLYWAVDNMMPGGCMVGRVSGALAQAKEALGL